LHGNRQLRNRNQTDCCGAGQTSPSPKNQLRSGKWLRWNLACDTPARAPSETSSPYMMSQIRIRCPHFDIDVPRLESHNVAPPPRNLASSPDEDVLTTTSSKTFIPIQWLGEKAEGDFRKTDQPCITPSHWIPVHFLVVGWTWNARFTKASAERAPLQPDDVRPIYTRWIPMIQPAPSQTPHDMLPKLRNKMPDSKTLDSEPGLSP
jgi:hypothetical protein